jgi:Ca2+-transporting ATPase
MDVTWHELSPQQVASRLEVEPGQGLDPRRVELSRASHGENRLAEKPPRPDWLLFLQQFNSLLIWVLIGAAVLAGAIGDLQDAVVIVGVVLFNAVLGFWQEHRAEATLAALKKMLSPEARVRRAGHVLEIPARELVPGDVVLLEPGNRVPADGRLLKASGLEVDESTLTGESDVVGKYSEALEREAPLAERFNMVYMNTLVARGRAEMLVTATGMKTEMGRVSAMLDEAEPGPTPLQVQLDGLGRRLSLIAGAIIALILALGLVREVPIVELVLSSIALAVAAIPEGLPAVVTVTLALGMHRMAKQRAIVKKLGSVETLGSTTVICSDKTGTLTLNQMTAHAVYFDGRRFEVTGEGYDADGQIEGADETDLGPILLAAALCNDSRVHEGRLIGAPTEGALLILAKKGGHEARELSLKHPRLAEIPFDAARKYRVTFHLDGECVRVFVVGAP